MIEHLSYSSIQKYLTCSRQWRFKYIDEIPVEEKSDALLFGSAWHKMIGLVVGGNDNLGNAWTKAISSVTEEKSDDAYADLVSLGMKMITSPTITPHLQGLNFWKMEQYMELNVPSVPVPIIGYIDAIRCDDNANVPIDFKTAGRKWTQEKADHSLQATMYIAMMYQAGLITSLPAKFEFHIFTKTKNPELQILETWRTAQDLIELYNLIGVVWDAIEQGIYVPNSSSYLCSQKYCDFYNRCKGGMIDVRTSETD